MGGRTAVTDGGQWMRWIGGFRRADLANPNAVMGLDAESAELRKRLFMMLAELLPDEDSAVRDYVAPDEIIRLIRATGD